MTPLGEKIRELRSLRGVTMKEMAAALRVSPAYLSALEHGRRGRPTWAQVQAIIGYFNVIWDEAEEIERLARLSHPRVIIDTSGLHPAATELANRLSEDIAHLTEVELSELNALLGRILQNHPARKAVRVRKSK